MIGKNLRKIIEQLLSMFCVLKKKRCPAYISKHNSNCEKQVILLMIPNGERSQYLEVKKLPVFLRGITSKHRCDFHCPSCLHSFATENKR